MKVTPSPYIIMYETSHQSSFHLAWTGASAPLRAVLATVVSYHPRFAMVQTYQPCLHCCSYASGSMGELVVPPWGVDGEAPLTPDIWGRGPGCLPEKRDGMLVIGTDMRGRWVPAADRYISLVQLFDDQQLATCKW
jgi:hypothetical protein